MADDDAALLLRLEAIAIEAGGAILRIAAHGVEARRKPDFSPVTQADQDAEAIILARLQASCPEIPVIAEEEASAGRVPDISGGVFFLVDPLDGTKEFIAGLPDYTVNIALVRNGVPALGVVYAPRRAALWAASPAGASRAEITAGQPGKRSALTMRPCAKPPVILASRSHLTPETTEFIAQHPGAETISIGSSLKFCMLAEGGADLYPRFGRTMEWDTAAGDAVLRAAGGMTRTLDGRSLAYGKAPAFANPDFIAGAC